MAWRIAAGAAAVAALLAAGCLRPLRYPCDDADACERDGQSGICEAGWCAYADDDCPSGYRWSSIADEVVARMCVPGHGDDSSSTSATSTGETTDASTSSSTDAGSSTTAADCESYCIAGPHSTAMCDAEGECIVTCEAPWANCDGDVATGCEVPVGVAHQCDAEGLDPVEGCWTAYCGESDAATAVNFGTYYCVDCITCEEPTAGNCHWCDHVTGHWFPVEACACGGDLGVVCGP